MASLISCAGTTPASIEARELPADCRETEDATLHAGERADMAAARLHVNLIRQNARTTRCAAWHDAQVRP